MTLVKEKTMEDVIKRIEQLEENIILLALLFFLLNFLLILFIIYF